jgi:hypothetical protein
LNAVANVKPKARILMCTEAEYRADPCVVPSLSQSTAHTLLTKSPLHAWSEHPRLGKVPRETTVAKIEGTVIHALLLGKGADDIEVLSYDNFKTKSSQIARDAVLNAGRTPVLARKYDEIVAAADRIRKNLADQGCVFEGGMAEVAIEWEEEGPEGPVLCRGRLDYLIVGEHRAKIIDPKKITSADVLTCMRHADDYGYHIQHTAYTSAVEKLYPHLAGRVDFEFAFTELDEPHASVPRAPDAMSKFVGAQQWSRAIEIWQQCMTSGVWSGYPITPLTVSPWVWREYEEGMSV